MNRGGFLRASALVLVAVSASIAVPYAAAGAETGPIGQCSWKEYELPLPAGATSSRVYGVSTNGTFFIGNVDDKPARWRGGRVEQLGLAFGKPTALWDVNTAGTSVGYIPISTGEAYAVVHRAGRYEYLPVPAGTTISEAKTINNKGDIAGSAVWGSRTHAVLWPASAPGTVQEINVGGAYDSSAAYRVDDQGRVLIWATGPGVDDGLVWSPDGTITRLPKLTPNAIAQPNGFRNGRVAGPTFDFGASDYPSLEWNLRGGQVTTLRINESPRTMFVDSGNTTVGVFNDGDIGFWRHGVLKETIKGSTLGGLTGFSDTGVIIGTKWNQVYRATSYRRSC
jgi:uncharacterized membrane protein